MQAGEDPEKTFYLEISVIHFYILKLMVIRAADIKNKTKYRLILMTC